MEFRRNPGTCGLAALLFLLANSGRSDAGFQLITNGDFEDGLTGWTTAAQAQSLGSWSVQSGTLSPLTGFSVPAPPGPTHAAMSDGNIGSFVLYQDFLVPQGGIASATLSFDRYIANRSASFNPYDTLDYNFGSSIFFRNRQVRVDILSSTSNPFSVSAGDVLLNLYRTAALDPPISGYTKQSVDLTAFLASHSGQTLRLRFAEVNGTLRFAQAPLNFGVDEVGLDMTMMAEPRSLALLAFGLLGLAAYLSRRQNHPASTPGSLDSARPVATQESDD